MIAEEHYVKYIEQEVDSTDWSVLHFVSKPGISKSITISRNDNNPLC